MNYKKNLSSFLMTFLHLNKSPYLLGLFWILLSTTLSSSSEEFPSLYMGRAPFLFSIFFPFPGSSLKLVGKETDEKDTLSQMIK